MKKFPTIDEFLQAAEHKVEESPHIDGKPHPSEEAFVAEAKRIAATQGGVYTPDQAMAAADYLERVLIEQATGDSESPVRGQVGTDGHFNNAHPRISGP